MIAKIVELFAFLVIVSATRNEYCKLACDNKPHTVCERGKQKCGAGSLCGRKFEMIKLTDDDRQSILDLHNELRNKVASGKQKPQPSAANMKALSYNKELEFIAQCWANSCNVNPLKHDVCRRTAQYSNVGQNLIWWNSTVPTRNMLKETKKSIMSWFNEVKHFDESSVQAFKCGAKMIEHYSQLVWADSCEIGCGISSYTSKKDGRKGKTLYNYLLVCNYGPGGNYLGTPVYTIGKPASDSSGGKPNKKYKSLCGKDKSLSKTPKYKNDFCKVSI